jgi:ABC-type proline/glycine betaine transport system permease subunit
MRKGHIIGGLTVFGIGLFLLYLNSAIVAEFIKGLVQPVLILLGLICLAAAIFARNDFKKINGVAAVIFLAVGLYGLWDEYYAVLDFVSGFTPVLFIVCGTISLVYGVKMNSRKPESDEF